MNIAPNCKDLADLAEVQGMAAHAASEIKVALAVYGTQMPSGAVRIFEALRASLSEVAK